jgi:hypothetical protein
METQFRWMVYYRPRHGMVPPGRDQGLGYLDVIDQGAFDEYQCLYSEDAASQVMLSTPNFQ